MAAVLLPEGDAGLDCQGSVFFYPCQEKVLLSFHTPDRKTFFFKALFKIVDLKVSDLFSSMEIQVKGVEKEGNILLVVHVSALVKVCVSDSVGIAALHAINSSWETLEGRKIQGCPLVGVRGIADGLRRADLPCLQVAQAALHPPFGQELIAIGDSEGLVETD